MNQATRTMNDPMSALRTVAIAMALFSMCLTSCDDGSGGDDPITGSETHFLRTCDGQCEEGFTCICGVCTEMCTETSSCTDQSDSATCESSQTLASAGACGQPPAMETQLCSVACTTDVDCTAISEDHVCFSGFCQAPPINVADVVDDSGADDDGGNDVADVMDDQPDAPCGPGQLDCSGVCIDPLLDEANCGSCGTACAAGQLCDNGACVVGNSCGTDADCQAGETCTNGVCMEDLCMAAEIDCGGICVDPEFDDNNCGSCGTACPAGQSCTRGICM